MLEPRSSDIENHCFQGSPDGDEAVSVQARMVTFCLLLCPLDQISSLHHPR
jgi:hypothetical protein